MRPAVPTVKDASASAQPDRRVHSREAGREETPGSLPRPTAGRWRGAPISTCTDCRPRRSRWTNSSTTRRRTPTKSSIDRLLASPRYGERWGRYWLDLVRYADTSGFETDHFFITAWRYRDWVIESFNRDKPYNTFVQEQIAADEMWPTNMDLEGHSKLPEGKRREPPPADRHQPVHDRFVPHRVHILRRPVSRRMAGRRGGHGGRGVPGADGRVRAVPRS